MKEIRFIELFAGIGGFRYGLENSQYAHISEESEQEECTQGGKRSTDERPILLHNRDKSPFRCVYANEWDKYAAQIYKERFKDEIDTRDIREVPAEEIPDHDLLTGGFPCQAFSIAGKRGGFEDTRGTLFFEIARIVQQKQPRLLLLENVKGLLSHDKGKTFGTILNTLDELGYDLQWQVLNSKDFGVPQNRERVFIVGHLRGTGRPEVFPIGGSNGTNPKELTQGVEQVDRAKVGIDLSTKESRLTRDARALQARYYKGYSTRKAETTGVVDNMKIRRLTPTECERLQGFPDGWTEGISDTQRYKCLGNAVTTNVIQEIGKKLINGKI